MGSILRFYILLANTLWTAHHTCHGKLFPQRTKLTWVNGIAHLPEHMSDPTFVISTIFGGVDVDYCHNPSSMTSESDYLGFVKDGIQASTHVMGRLTPEVDSLVEHLRDALAQVGKNGRVIHIAHSQGSVITWLAAQRLKPEECKRIEIISFGGAATICTSEFPFARCINYYAVNDPILNVVPSAVRALKSGFSFGDGMQQEIIFLASRTGDPVTDHGLLNPTYLEALVWEGQRYQSLFLSPLGQMAGAAFVGPLSSTVTWFPNFAYEITRRALIAIVHIFTLLWELLQATVTRLLGKEERYDPILLKT
ncbi:hypothetical protein ACHAXM_005761 [Skeletonema potamos]|jgi:pimeloyl-ACP methyl ester carboxylesterase